MPPLALASMLHRALPWLSPEGRAVVNTLVCDNGRVDSIHTLCERVGLRSRYQLGRLLHREGLPPFEELSGWVSVLYWMLRADAGAGGGRLRSLAGLTHTQVATSYRIVRRVTGHCWKEIRRAGTAQVLGWFQRRAHPPQLRPRPLAERSGGGAVNQIFIMPGVAGVRTKTAAGPQRLALTGWPFGVAVRGRDLAYITRGHGAAIQCLDLLAGRFIGSVPVGCAPSCVTFDPSGERAYASIQHLGEIAVVDARDHRLFKTWRVPGDPFPLVLSPSGRTLFVATNEDRLFALSTQNGRIIGSLPLPATSHHMALNPAGDRLYVTTRTAGVILEVDAMRLLVLRSFRVGGWPQGVVVSGDGGTLYAANEHHGLDVIGLGSGRPIARLDSESGAVALALSADQRFLYTGLVHAGNVGIVDVAILSRHGVLETGGRPGQIAFDGASRGRVIVPNEAGWVDLFPVDTFSLARWRHIPPNDTSAALSS